MRRGEGLRRSAHGAIFQFKAVLSVLVPAALLVALTVIVHGTGMVGLLRWVWRAQSGVGTRFSSQTWLLVRLAWTLLAIHLVEIGIWALFYWRRGCLPTLESAVYFAGVTYTTLGYGDLVLPQRWRLLGPIQGLTGILMCGLSTGFFFAVVTKLYQALKDDNRGRVTGEMCAGKR
jgi:hypothetical protein